MSSGQTIFVLRTTILFELMSLRFNSTIPENYTSGIEDKVYLTAFSLADEPIEEIKDNVFDKKTIDFLATVASLLLLNFFLNKDFQ